MEPIKLRRAKNYRDLGGIKTADGRTVKNNMLLRGTPLRKMYKKDIETLRKNYNLTTIIDLRTAREAAERPDAKLPDLKYLNMPILTEAKAGISHEHKVHSLRTLKNMPTMEEMYIDMVTNDCLENLIKVLKTILLMDVKDYAVVFHCSAGKDRTGILSALILAFLGVERSDILRDYLLTNKVTKKKSQFIYLGLLLVSGKHSFAKKIKMYYIAKESFLESALQSLENKFGSLEKFFIEKLELSKDEIEIIKIKFLE